MDWIMPVNDMLEEEITKLTHTLMPPYFNGDVRAVRTLQESLAKVIDFMGEQSASAQGLNKVITSADKLRSSPTHYLYLLKDHRAKQGRGDVIGMLKVGRKHLFLFDEKHQAREVEPLCVLDFYVVRDRQRMGHGRQLFDYMLNDLEMVPWQLAIDGPSAKMEQFLNTNYGLERLVRQSNNFAVSPSFFDSTDEEISKFAGRHTPSAASAVGRFAAPKPASAIANVIHGPVLEENRRTPSPGAAADVRDEDEPEYWDEEEWPSDNDEEEPYGREEPPAEQPGPERPSTLGVARDNEANVPAAGVPSGAVTPAAGVPSGAATPAGARRDSQLTDRGYFDVKYYHNKLW